MNAFIQFVTFDQGKKSLALLGLAEALLGGDSVREGYSWIGLNGRKTEVSSLACLLVEAGKFKFSQIGYEAKFKPIRISSAAAIKEAFGVLQIPATSPLWADANYWERSNIPSIYRRARQARRIASEIERSTIKAFPAVFELTLKFNSQLNQDELANALAQWMIKKIGESYLKRLACAVIDFGDYMLFSKMEELNLSAVEYSLVLFLHRFVLGTPLLKTRIDRLHALHIFPHKRLLKIGKALGLSKPRLMANRFGVLVIPKSVINNPRSSASVADLAIPRDETTSWAGIVRRLAKEAKN